MPYATPADLALRHGADRLIELTDRDRDGIGDDPQIAQALLDASFEIDGYLAARYKLPLPTVPPLLARIACDIAVYRLLSLRRMGDIEDARRRYEDARRLLENLAKGVVALGLPADLPDPQQPQPSLAAASVGSPRVMGRNATGGY
jgi:phage gp36-like protein